MIHYIILVVKVGDELTTTWYKFSKVSSEVIWHITFSSEVSCEILFFEFLSAPQPRSFADRGRRAARAISYIYYILYVCIRIHVYIYIDMFTHFYELSAPQSRPRAAPGRPVQQCCRQLAYMYIQTNRIHICTILYVQSCWCALLYHMYHICRLCKYYLRNLNTVWIYIFVNILCVYIHEHMYLYIYTYSRWMCCKRERDCNRLHHTATHSIHTAGGCAVRERETATDCNRLQQTATDCNTLCTYSRWMCCRLCKYDVRNIYNFIFICMYICRCR